MIKLIFKGNGLRYVLLGIITSTFVIVGCGGDSGKDEPTDFSNVKKSKTPGLSAWHEENGFGPVKKKLKLGPINTEMAATGEKIFESKCATCHKLDERYTGPAQRDVLQRISPEFFLNMVLNPDENIEKHPRTKKMLAEYMNKMTNQNINMKDARALLEYFRLLADELEQNQQTN